MKKLMSAVVTMIFAICLFTATAMTTSAAAIKKVADFKAAATPTSVTLTWTASKDATGYQVQQFKDGEWETIKTIKKAKTKKLAVKRLTPKKNYKFRICAVKGNKKGAYKTIKAKTNIAKVTGLTVQAAGANSARLSWNKINGANGYEIQKLVGNKWQKVKTVKKATATNIANLAIGQTTSFRVRAFATHIGKNHFGGFSANQSFTLTMMEMSGLTVKSATENSVTVAWNSVPGANGYQVEKFDAGKWVSVNNAVGKGITQYTVTGLPSLTTVQIRVRACAVSGATNNWATVSGSTSIGLAGNLTYSNLTATSVKLAWTAAPGAKGYYIKNGNTTIATVNTNSATVTLSPATGYNLAVVPFADSVTGFATNAVSFTTAPAKVTALTASTVADTSVTLSWAKVAGATRYSVQYSKNGGAWTTVSATSNSYIAKNLTSNTNYKFRVSAVNKNGSAEQMGEYAEITVLTKLSAITGFKYSDLTATSAKLTWNAVSGATEYIIKNGNATVKTVNTNYAVVDLSPSTAYSFTVTPKSSLQTGSASAAVSFSFIASEGSAAAYGDNSITLNWPAQAGVSQYRVVRKTGASLDYEEILAASVTSATYTLAPGFSYIVEIYADNNCIASFDFETEEMDLSDKSDASVNGQLLYLAEAINRTKYDKNYDVTIDCKSTMTNSINYLDFGIQNLSGFAAGAVNLAFHGIFDSILKDTNHEISNGYIKCKDASAISAFFGFMNSDTGAGEDQMNQTEVKVEEASKHFTTGQSYNGGFKYNLIQPSNDDKALAYIYNAADSSAWKNGFSSVTTTKTADGYRIEAVLKQETAPNYHNGLISAFSAENMDFGGDATVASKVGQSKIIAETDSHDRLVSLYIDSPYILDVKVELPLNMSDAEGAFAGLGNVVIEMNMDMTGSTKYEYKFTNTY